MDGLSYGTKPQGFVWLPHTCVYLCASTTLRHIDTHAYTHTQKTKLQNRKTLCFQSPFLCIYVYIL